MPFGFGGPPGLSSVDRKINTAKHLSDFYWNLAQVEVDPEQCNVFLERALYYEDRVHQLKGLPDDRS